MFLFMLHCIIAYDFQCHSLFMSLVSLSVLQCYRVGYSLNEHSKLWQGGFLKINLEFDETSQDSRLRRGIIEVRGVMPVLATCIDFRQTAGQPWYSILVLTGNAITHSDLKAFKGCCFSLV